VKVKSAKTKAISPVDVDKLSEEMRQRGNKLTDQERRKYRDQALRIIYSSDATSNVSRG
jgi:hypothetical protein